jgi:hypothetical protein
MSAILSFKSPPLSVLNHRIAILVNQESDPTVPFPVGVEPRRRRAPPPGARFLTSGRWVSGIGFGDFTTGPHYLNYSHQVVSGPSP